MASRLMLSLKKTAAEPQGGWSLETMTGTHRGPIGFAPQATGRSHEIPLTPSEVDIELDVVPSSSRNHGLRKASQF